jgi:hypothetical protein
MPNDNAVTKRWTAEARERQSAAAYQTGFPARGRAARDAKRKRQPQHEALALALAAFMPKRELSS